ncbi:Thaumatin protein 1b [Spatholobus suberectus]|nr:Thaumatin protein 1b [Spatholobus suberectus]
MGESYTVSAPATWKGRIWGRTLCPTDPVTKKFSCVTGDCGSGKVDYNGKGGSPLATVVDIILNCEEQLNTVVLSCLLGSFKALGQALLNVWAYRVDSDMPGFKFPMQQNKGILKLYAAQAFWHATICPFPLTLSSHRHTAFRSFGHLVLPQLLPGVPKGTTITGTLNLFSKLVEINASSTGRHDSYEVSFNVPVMVVLFGVPGSSCGSTGCPKDLNARELRVKEKGQVVAYQNACAAYNFEIPLFCCIENLNPGMCKSTLYAQMFKRACPKALKLPNKHDRTGRLCLIVLL